MPRWGVSEEPVLFLLKQDAPAGAYRLLNRLAELVQEPRQSYFKSDVVLCNLHSAHRDLPECPHLELETVLGPDFLLDLEDRKCL